MLGRLSASLNLVCTVRWPSLKFTCRRRRWRSTKEENTTIFRHASTGADTFTKQLPVTMFWVSLDATYYLLWSSASLSCHRRRQLRTPLFRWGERFANKVLSALGCGYRSLGCHSERVAILNNLSATQNRHSYFMLGQKNSFTHFEVSGLLMLGSSVYLSLKSLN